MNLPTQKPTLRESRMRELFGARRFELLRADLDHVSGPTARESVIIRHLCDALRDVGGEYVLTFVITDKHGTRTQQYLIYVTKSTKGLTIMKEIMAGQSTEQILCDAEYGFSPASSGQATLLTNLYPPTDTLADELLKRFAGRCIKVSDVYSEHGTTTHFRERDYKKALKKLESESRIAVDPPADKRKRDTLSNDALLTFPKLG
jgi:hypothetical protein